MDGRIFLGQVGDSRAYILRADEIFLVTKDQSLLNQLLEAGQIEIVGHHTEQIVRLADDLFVLPTLGIDDLAEVLFGVLANLFEIGGQLHVSRQTGGLGTGHIALRTYLGSW